MAHQLSQLCQHFQVNHSYPDGAFLIALSIASRKAMARRDMSESIEGSALASPPARLFDSCTTARQEPWATTVISWSVEAS